MSLTLCNTFCKLVIRSRLNSIMRLTNEKYNSVYISLLAPKQFGTRNVVLIDSGIGGFLFMGAYHA
jgi:hypothetical protein